MDHAEDGDDESEELTEDAFNLQTTEEMTMAGWSLLRKVGNSWS